MEPSSAEEAQLTVRGGGLEVYRDFSLGYVVYFVLLSVYPFVMMGVQQE
jgi:hypothetical protein